MKLSVRPDRDVVAVGAADEICVLVEITAPPATRSSDRPPATLQVVLDRSGSMAGSALSGAVEALCHLVTNLDDRDNFGVVAFDNTATVVVPAGPLRDKGAVVRRLRAIEPGGRTDVSSGYLRGLQELRRVDRGRGGTILLLSDGYANAGVIDPAELGRIANRAAGDKVTTSTLGYGLGYDETALVAMARDGSGNHHFAKDPAAAGTAVASEVTELLAKSAQAVSMVLRLAPGVAVRQVYNDLPVNHAAAEEVVLELGDLCSGEQRMLVLRLGLQHMEPGPAALGTVEVRYVELPGLAEHTVAQPLRVDVVPGRQAAGQVPDPRVLTEVLFQEAQLAKRGASEALELGERELAAQLLGEAEASLLAALEIAPDGSAGEVAGEHRDIASLRERTVWDDPNLLSKASRASYHKRNRRRGGRDPDVDQDQGSQ